MSSETMHRIVGIIEAEVRERPSAIEFEMAYQARVAIDRIKFAIKHADQFGKPCDAMKEAGMQLLDALQRLESLDRRFQARSGIGRVGERATPLGATHSPLVEPDKRISRHPALLKLSPQACTGS